MTPRSPGASGRPGALDAVTVAGLLAAVYVGKRFYSAAGVEDLVWVLGPTATLTGWLVGGSFELEAAYGFVDTGLRFAIVPACAGINFLLVAFMALATALVLGERRSIRRLTRLLAAGLFAYVATIVANSLRIALAVGWHVSQPELGWLTAARWHRVEGVVVYMVVLLVVHELATIWRRRSDAVSP